MYTVCVCVPVVVSPLWDAKRDFTHHVWTPHPNRFACRVQSTAVGHVIKRLHFVEQFFDDTTKLWRAPWPFDSFSVASSFEASSSSRRDIFYICLVDPLPYWFLENIATRSLQARKKAVGEHLLASFALLHPAGGFASQRSRKAPWSHQISMIIRDNISIHNLLGFVDDLLQKLLVFLGFL